MMAQKTFCASARLEQLQPSRNHRIIRTLRANQVGYRSWASLSLCFTTTIQKSKDLPPKSQDFRAIIETSQRMCIQASKTRDGMNGSIQYPSSSISSCPAQNIKHIKHISKHQQITGSTGKNPGNKSPYTPWSFTPGPMGIRKIMKPFDWQISLPSPHFQCLDFFAIVFQAKCFELLNCSFFFYLQALTKSSNPSAHGLSTQMIMVIPACSRSMMKRLPEIVIACVSVSHPFSC